MTRSRPATLRHSGDPRSALTRSPAPWERQPGESAPAFEAFACYRDMGVERSTAKVGWELRKSKTLMDRWCSAWEWVARARAFDAWVDERLCEAFVDALTDQASDLGSQAAALGNEGLAAIRALVDNHPAGVPPLSVRDAIALMESGSRIARAALMREDRRW